MDKAICWELASQSNDIIGVRAFVAGRFSGVQILVHGNDKPRWEIREFNTPTDAANATVTLTQGYENMYGCVLSVEPGEVILHDSERAALTQGGRIPPSLRARLYTSLHRRRHPVPTS